MSKEITLSEALESKNETSRRGRKRHVLDTDLILSCHEMGFSAAAIADILTEHGQNVCTATVRKRLHEQGAKLKRGPSKERLDKSLIMALYHDEGMTLAETAKELQVSVVTLRKRMREYNIDARHAGRPKKVVKD